MTPGSEDGCKEAGSMFSSKCATHGSRFTSDSSGGGSWFRSRPAEAMDWRKLMMIEELTSLGARAGYK